jgi:hypothetical protein
MKSCAKNILLIVCFACLLSIIRPDACLRQKVQPGGRSKYIRERHWLQILYAGSIRPENVRLPDYEAFQDRALGRIVEYFKSPGLSYTGRPPGQGACFSGELLTLWRTAAGAGYFLPAAPSRNRLSSLLRSWTSSINSVAANLAINLKF